MSGWIKLHRGIKTHWIYTDKRKFSRFEAWTDILLTVNYAPAKTMIKGKLIEIKRGQSILSLDSWANNWNWDKSSVRRFLELLKKDGMIQLENETVTTRLTVCNYDSYQLEENAKKTQVKRKRNADETQTTPIKEEEERKEEKQTNNIPTKDEFIAYALSIMPDVSLTDLGLKYQSWLVNDWCINRKGNLEKILNWKSTLTNTLKYLDKEPIKVNGTPIYKAPWQ
jgi:hypothetical protein